MLLDSLRSLMDVYRNGTQVAGGTHCYITPAGAGAANWEIASAGVGLTTTP
jgi:hypothetical protein